MSDDLRERLTAVRTEVGKAVVGQEAAVSGLIVALLARGHVLLEGDVGVCCACMPTVAGPVLHFFRDKVPSKLSSVTKSITSRTASITKPPKIYRTPGGDDSMARLPSNASTRDLEMNDLPGNYGGIEKTTVTSVYTLPPIHVSGDDERLIDQRQGRVGKSRWDV